MNYTKEQIEAAVKSKGYVWFDNGSDYNLNIVGIRNSATNNKVTNKFDDLITVSYTVNGVWQVNQWKATTEPGITWVLNFENKNGVAILVPNQYRGSHKVGLHRGQYEALVQAKPVKVWRDKDKDLVYDHELTDTGEFGINIHHAGNDSIDIMNWSAGCQVFKRLAEFNQFMLLVNQSKKLYGNSFTYTLIESLDIV